MLFPLWKFSKDGAQRMPQSRGVASQNYSPQNFDEVL